MSLAPDSSTASWAALRSDCPITLGSPFWVRGRIAPTRTGPVPTVSPTAAPPLENFNEVSPSMNPPPNDRAPTNHGHAHPYAHSSTLARHAAKPPTIAR